MALGLALGLWLALPLSASIRRTPWGGDLPFEPGIDITNSYTYTTNVDARRDSSADHIYNLGATGSISRNEGVYQARASTGMGYQLARNTGSLTSLNPNASASVSGPNREGARLRGSTQFSWNRSTAGDPIAGRILRTDAMSLSGSVTYAYSPKLSLSASPSFAYTDVDIGADRVNFGTSVQSSYVYSEKLNLSLGSGFNESQSLGEDARRTRNYTLFAGADGDLLPKVTGGLDLGASYATTNVPGAESTPRPFVAADLNWTASEKTSVGLSASSDLTIAVTNDAAQAYNFGLNVTHQLATRWSVFAGVSYGLTILDGEVPRTDHTLGSNVGISATATDWLNFSLGTSHSVNRSTASEATFQRISTTLSASISF